MQLAARLDLNDGQICAYSKRGQGACNVRFLIISFNHCKKVT